MLAALGFVEFILRKIKGLELLGGEGSIDVVEKIGAGFPTEFLELKGDRLGVFQSIISAGVIAVAAIKVDADGFLLCGLRGEDVLEEVLFLNLKSTGKAGGEPEDFGMFPGERDAADAAHG